MSWTITPRFTPADEYFQNVSLLLHGNGTNGSTTITDNSPTPKNVVPVGNAQISTAQSKFGGSSIAFGGGSDKVTVPAGTDFVYNTGNFTVECWFYANNVALPAYGSILLSQTESGVNYFVCALGNDSSTPSQFVRVNYPGSPGGVTSSTQYTNDTWNHYAFVRNSGIATVYLNGVGGTSAACTFNFNNTSYVPTLGQFTHSASLRLNGYIDDLRITKGVARYTSNFTPPAAPFPDI